MMEPIGDPTGVPDVDFALAPMTAEPRATDPVEFAPAREVLVSFEDFYRSHRTPIGRALAMTLRDTELAAEAVDEAMARAYQRWGHVSTLDNPGGWVYRVGLNWSLSLLRRVKRRQPVWMSHPEHTPAPTMQDPAIDRALASLPVDQRAVVVCRLLMGLPELQTADVLGIRPGTVKSRLHRALEKLAPLLAPLEEAS
jgi:RNA polymerase sigma-70 factor (ECF subfamily)